MNRGNRADFLFDEANTVGPYEVRQDGEVQRLFVVNLLDARESDLKPRPDFRIGDENVVAGETGRRSHELWKVLTAVAFVLLLLEWFLYTRRIA